MDKFRKNADNNEDNNKNNVNNNQKKALEILKAFGINAYDEYEWWKEKRKIGFIVNPIAGMGGKVGLKGTDGKYKEALRLGAKPIAPLRALEFLSFLKPYKEMFDLYTYPKMMGEYEALHTGFKPIVVGKLDEVDSKGESESKGIDEFNTSAKDTKNAAKLLINSDILIFVGGDGTARDIYEVVKDKIPVLGVPSGVKMHSAVFALNSKAAANVILEFLRKKTNLELREVVDIDEDAFRRGKVSAKIYGYMKVPVTSLVQSFKRTYSSSTAEIASIANNIKLESNTVYIFGPGSTTYYIVKHMGLEKTLLGVDLIMNGKIIVKDAKETDILSAIENRKAKIVVTPIGGQGFIFGRGNQQISAEVIKRVGKENIIVVATKSKLNEIDVLRVDTGDLLLDEELKGYIDVLTGDGKVRFKVE